jgi:glycosyltransferase involved in cell wall biosynthesis
MRRFEGVVAVSQEIFRELEALGFEPPQLKYIANGVDIARYAPGARRAIRSLSSTRRPIPESNVVVAAIGSLTEEKGHDHLLRAVAALDVGSGVELLIAGDGPRRKRLHELASDLGIADRVEFLGRRSDIRDLLEAADIFVLPSLSEGLPIALLEAMACERACVATDVGDVAQAIETDVTGVLVRAADKDALAAAIKRLAQDPQLRQRLGEAARQRVLERFSADKMIAAYCALYDDLLAVG